jgi:hypothetical protein
VPTRAGDICLDLQPPIDGLRALKGDLDAYYWRCVSGGAGESVAYEVAFWVRQLSDRTVALEQIVLHKGTTRLSLDGTKTDGVAVGRACRLIEAWLDEDEPLESARTIVGRILHAADVIALRAARAAAP